MPDHNVHGRSIWCYGALPRWKITIGCKVCPAWLAFQDTSLVKGGAPAKFRCESIFVTVFRQIAITER